MSAWIKTLDSIKPYQWFIFAFLYRVIASSTHASWNHPDEWYQTVEFAQQIAAGFQSYTQEVALHMRNLSWPWVLSLVIRLSEWLAEGQLSTRLFLIHFVSGLFNLSMVYAMWKSAQGYFSTKLQSRLLVILLLPWFFVSDSIRPSQENMAAVFFWWAFLAGTRGFYFWSALFAVGVFAMKYPVGVLSLGLALGFTFQILKNREGLLVWIRWVSGFVGGFILFSICDWLYYGRPWESFWMYSLYNVWSGLSHELFGSQSLTTYWKYWFGHWGGVLIPFALVGLVFLFRGILKGLKSFHPVVISFLLYLVAHFLISHKEARFMAPIETLAIWVAFMGAVTIPKKWNWTKNRYVHALLGISLILNFGVFARELWGQNWVADRTYFEINDQYHRAKQSHPVCALVTVRRPLSVFLKLDLPTAYLPIARRKPLEAELAEKPLLWVEEKAKDCQESSTGEVPSVLLHLHKPNHFWSQQDCKLLPSGILNLVPERRWNEVVENNWASGTWYECPSRILGSFHKQEVRHILARGFTPIETLPPLKNARDSLLSLREKNRRNLDDGTFPDW